ncbi:hypothetical protein Trydic_g9861 [Trypoxylus dichotomus]
MRAPIPQIYGARGVAFTTEDKAVAFTETLERQCSPDYENADVNRIGRIHYRVREILTSEEDIPIQEGPRTGWHHLSRSQARHREIHHVYDKHMQRRASFATLPIPMEASARGHDPQARELAAELPSGFSRATHQVLCIAEKIKEGFNLREYTGAVLLDVAKVFDKVWHQGLLLNMHRPGISEAMARPVHSYLRQRASKINLGGQRFTVRAATAGVTFASRPRL